MVAAGQVGPARHVDGVERLRPGGHLYLTVEEVDDQELDAVFAEATAQGLPVVRGEESREGYHYYPSRDQVAGWLRESGLAVVAEADDPADGYSYWHLLTRPA